MVEKGIIFRALAGTKRLLLTRLQANRDELGVVSQRSRHQLSRYPIPKTEMVEGFKPGVIRENNNPLSELDI